MRFTALLMLGSAVASLPLSDESSKEAADISDQAGELEQKIEELLDHSDMTPEELADLLNEDIDSEEVEYIVEAVDEGGARCWRGRGRGSPGHGATRNRTAPASGSHRRTAGRPAGNGRPPPSRRGRAGRPSPGRG